MTDTATVRFDEYNLNWTPDQVSNEIFIKGVMMHMTNVLQARGHVFLNDILDQLRIPRTQFGQTHGWIYDKDSHSYVDYAVVRSGEAPHTIFDIQFTECREILDALP